MLEFDWDENKNRQNYKKHGVTFEEAQTTFYDEDAMEFSDPEHSDDEERFLLVGRSFHLRVLVVCHCFRQDDEIIRLISARKATKNERQFYGRRGKA